MLRTAVPQGISAVLPPVDRLPAMAGSEDILLVLNCSTQGSSGAAGLLDKQLSRAPPVQTVGGTYRVVAR